MTEEHTFAAEIRPGDPSDAATRLEEGSFAGASYFEVFEREVREQPELRSTFVEGVCRTASPALACRDLLKEACHCENKKTRRDLVAAFRDAHRDEELFLGATLLTAEDGTAVFRDYFDSGGELTDALEWVSTLAEGYRREKRKGNIEPDYDGIFQDAWDAVKEAGKTIAQTIKDAVDDITDALRQAGEGLKEVVSDLAEFAQRRVNSVIETVFDEVSDIAEQTWRFLDAVSEKAFSTIETVVKGLASAPQTTLKMIFDAASDVGDTLLREATRVLENAGETLNDIVQAVGQISKKVATTVTQALIDMVSYAQERASRLLNKFREAFEDAAELLEHLTEKFAEYVNEWIEKAKNAVEDGWNAVKSIIIDAAQKGRDAAKSAFGVVLEAGKTAGWILEVVHDAVSGFFETAVDVLNKMVRPDKLYSSVFGVGLLGAVFEALASLGEPLADLVAWARDKGADAVDALFSVFSAVGELARDAVYRLGKAFKEFGHDLTAFLNTAIEWGKNKAYVAFYGVLAGGAAVKDLLEHVWDHARDWFETGIETILRIGVRIKDLLRAAWRIAGDLFRGLVEHLVEIGRSAWYILDWVADTVTRVGEALEEVFDALIDISWELADLVAWCARRAADVMEAGFRALRSIGQSVGAILVALLTNPSNVFSTAVRELHDIVGDLTAFFEAAADAAEDILGRLYRALRNIGFEVGEMLDAIAGLARETFVQLAEGLLELGVEVFEMILWAVNETFEIFGWVMDAVETVVDSWLDLLEWVVSLAPEPIERVGRWLADRAGEAFEFVRDKILAPIVAAGKLAILATLAAAAAPFLVVAWVGLGSLVDESKTPYKDWPDEFRAFECHVRAKCKELVEPTEDNGRAIVVMSDLHMEDQDDIDAGLGHFDENAGLVRSVLDYYADPADYEWTVVVNGDSEEFWKDNDLTTNEPAQKVDDIAATHPGVHDRFSEEFYKFQFPRRLIKLRGNHDAAYEDPHVVNTYRDNGFPDIEVYDYVTTRFDGQDLVIMHGQQFDPYNCSANDDFGRFASNFASEPIDTWNDILTDIFGDDARIEGKEMVIPVLGLQIPVPVDFFAPYYERSEWEDFVEPGGDGSSVKDPSVDDGVMFEESEVVDTINGWETSLIIGHTHDPKLLPADDGDHFYVNSGTSGWWEGCVWTVEITPEDVRLVGWTENNGSRDRTYVVALNGPDDDDNTEFDDNDDYITTDDYDGTL